MPRCRPLLVLAVTLAAVPSAFAWGPEGHRIVAELAQRHLDPAAAAQVERLLAPEHTRRLADVANWADDLRHDPSQARLWKQTRAMHYVDMPGSHCHYEPPRDCRGGRCVVAALQHYEGVLADRGQPAAARREALKFVVHFAGDIHQPLHAGYRDDRGGNDYQVQFRGRGSNLHKVWDSGMLDTRGLDWRTYAHRLDARGPVSLPAPLAPGAGRYAQWAEESCRISLEAYPPGHVIDEAYVDARLPVAEQRLRQAGRRLAELLNEALGSR